MGQWMEGSHAALPIWAEIMKGLHADLPPEPFPVPDGVVKVAVCRQSGLLSSRYCKSTVQEVFIEGEEPTRVCDRHTHGEGARTGTGLGLRELDRLDQEEDLPSH
jgi:penicillin-binding protein 1A